MTKRRRSSDDFERWSMRFKGPVPAGAASFTQHSQRLFRPDGFRYVAGAGVELLRVVLFRHSGERRNQFQWYTPLDVAELPKLEGIAFDTSEPGDMYLISLRNRSASTIALELELVGVALKD